MSIPIPSQPAIRRPIRSQSSDAIQRARAGTTVVVERPHGKRRLSLDPLALRNLRNTREAQFDRAQEHVAQQLGPRDFDTPSPPDLPPPPSHHFDPGKLPAILGSIDAHMQARAAASPDYAAEHPMRAQAPSLSPVATPRMPAPEALMLGRQFNGLKTAFLAAASPTKTKQDLPLPPELHGLFRSMVDCKKAIPADSLLLASVQSALNEADMGRQGMPIIDRSVLAIQLIPNRLAAALAEAATEFSYEAANDQSGMDRAASQFERTIERFSKELGKAITLLGAALSQLPTTATHTPTFNALRAQLRALESLKSQLQQPNGFIPIRMAALREWSGSNAQAPLQVEEDDPAPPTYIPLSPVPDYIPAAPVIKR